MVALLEADPNTGGSKVDIEALRQHLIDMDNVTLRADAKSARIDGGVGCEVAGEGAVRRTRSGACRSPRRDDERRRRLALWRSPP